LAITSGLTLFIDIDGTLLQRNETAAAGVAGSFQAGHELFEVIQRFAILHGGQPRQVRERIEHVTLRGPWWDWDDFLAALDLNRQSFWRFAASVESAYLMPVCDSLIDVLNQLQICGFRMFIASNNPLSGIHHKLRLAGLDNGHQRCLFEGFLGTSNMQAMKASVDFWRRALESTGTPADRVITIGDNPLDDAEVPSQAGIEKHILLNHIDSTAARPGIQMAGDWLDVLCRLKELSYASILDSNFVEH